MKKVYAVGLAILLGLALAIGPAAARSSGGSSHNSGSSHSSGSHGSRAKSSATSSKTLPPGTHFMRKTCKTAACKGKHPGGSYMLPIKPKTANAPKNAA